MYIYSLLPDFLKKKNFKSSRTYRRFQNAERKFHQEIDVCKLLKSVRVSKVLARTTLNAQQNLMLKFQRTNLIETTDNTESGHDKTITDLNHHNPLVRIFALGKIHRTLHKFTA